MNNRIISLKKLVGALGLLIIVGSPTSLVVSTINSKQVKVPTQTELELVVNAINAINYEQVMDINSKLNDLEKEVNVSLIKEKLPLEIVKIFRDDLFTVNKITNNQDIELSNHDLAKFGVINAKINYNYGEKKNQFTNLKIDVVTVRNNLNDIFNRFEFKDKEGISGFLDINDLEVINRQIANYIDKSLDVAGLVLENRTSNSIVLKAKRTSRQYKGYANLTWNLKLFEIWGEGSIPGNTEYWISQGLKGYFYLNKSDNKIKFFNYLERFDVDFPIHQHFDGYHKFIFSNDKNKKEFTFNGKDTLKENEINFGSFPFDKGVKVEFFSPEPDRIKIFNKVKNRWEGFELSSREFIINSLGELTEIK